MQHERQGQRLRQRLRREFFHTLKVELIHGQRSATRAQTRRCVFEYVEVDYNQTRQHCANGYVSPTAFETQQVAWCVVRCVLCVVCCVLLVGRIPRSQVRHSARGQRGVQWSRGRSLSMVRRCASLHWQ